MAELVDAPDLKSSDHMVVWVRVPFGVHGKLYKVDVRSNVTPWLYLCVCFEAYIREM